MALLVGIALNALLLSAFRHLATELCRRLGLTNAIRCLPALAVVQPG